MIDYPKYILVLAKRPIMTFVILENASIINPETQQEEIASRMYASYDNVSEAFIAFAQLSDGPVIIGASAQPIDNTFDIRGY